MKRQMFLHNEEGFSSVGVVLALLISLALIFSAGQIYRINTIAAKTQNVADSASLAAQNEVAEFMIAAKICDAVILSLSLGSLAATGLGVVSLCVPATAGASEGFLKAGQEMLHAREAFSEKATEGLTAFQNYLPLIAAANAASVAAANNTEDEHYSTLALLVPSKGKEISGSSSQDIADTQDEIDKHSDEVRQEAQRADQAAKRADEAKQKGFYHDCGAHPDYCLYERAAQLASLSGRDNPLYHSVDTWSFSVALARAQAYYPARLANEVPQDSSVKAQVQSALRKNFYAWASQEVGQGYVHETPDSFEASFPHLPKNTEEMRKTSLYTDEIYPRTTDEQGQNTLHAWKGCPCANGATAYGSLAELESGSYASCEICQFSASSLGKVAAASTSIENGFEYHYEAVSQAAQEYEQARSELDPITKEVKHKVSGLLDKIGESLGKVGGNRINAEPPGSSGVITMMAQDVDSREKGFESSFVKSTKTLGVGAALSAATLIPEQGGATQSVISSLLDGFSQNGHEGVGVGATVLECWSGLLGAYAQGQSALESAIQSSLESLPLVGSSGLGKWAAGAFRSVIELTNLEPANLDALKPALVNTAHIEKHDESALSARLLSLKEQALAHPLASNDVFSSALDAAKLSILDVVLPPDNKITIAHIEPLGKDGPSLPLEINLPPALRDISSETLSRLTEHLRKLYAQESGVTLWE